jgi:hypothetical protein
MLEESGVRRTSEDFVGFGFKDGGTSIPQLVA